MKRPLVLLGASLLFLGSFASSASAQSPHFRKGGEPVCTVTSPNGSTASTSCKGALAGLGDRSLVIRRPSKVGCSQSAKTKAEILLQSDSPNRTSHCSYHHSRRRDQERQCAVRDRSRGHDDDPPHAGWPARHAAGLRLSDSRIGIRVQRRDYRGLAVYYVEEALARWEPRITLPEVTADADPAGPERLLIRIEYEIKAARPSYPGVPVLPDSRRSSGRPRDRTHAAAHRPLDDRRFQDIVDQAKRLIPQYCPEWTDHNVSDPGVALIELFAWMTDLLLYRVNQVPDKMYTSSSSS